MNQVTRLGNILAKYRPVQICLECKKRGKVKMTNTVPEMWSHIIEAHRE